MTPSLTHKLGELACQRYWLVQKARRLRIIGIVPRGHRMRPVFARVIRKNRAECSRLIREAFGQE